MKADYREFSVTDFVEDDFFIKYAKGGDASCESFWQAFMKENPSKAAEIAEAERIVRHLQSPVYGMDADSLERMKNSILLDIKKVKQQTSTGFADDKASSVSRRYPAFLRYAAIISLPLVMSFFLYFWLSERSTETGANPAYNEGFQEMMEKRINPRGQKSVLFLADGSKVWLNAESTLNYDKDLVTSDRRDVFLEGEAFFEVAHHADKPFVVHTCDLIIHVHGTSFNVKAYAGEGRIETTLVKGKVSIRKEGDPSSHASLVLNPNQRAVFLKEDRTMKVQEVSADRTAEWREDRLVFDETPLEEVITQLERWYGVKMHVYENTDLSCTLTAKVEKESLAQVMDLLAASQKITYSIKANEVFIKGSLCQ